MAQEIQKFSVTIPSGTDIAAAQVFSLGFAPRKVNEVEIMIPPGPRGEVGFQLGFGGSQLIPFTPGQWVVADDEVIHWPLEDMPDSGAWQLIAYNTGTYDHTLEVRFLCDLVGVTDTTPPAAIDGAVISSSPSLA